MCFIIHPKYPDAIKASKPITCYKLMYCDAIKKRYVSAYRKGKYKIGKLHREKRFEFAFGDAEISVGLHSYRFYDTAKRMRKTWQHLRGTRILECVIPKGTLYYQDPINNEYVSLAIKPIKEVK